jgi:hypothetical protein
MWGCVWGCPVAQEVQQHSGGGAVGHQGEVRTAVVLDDRGGGEEGGGGGWVGGCVQAGAAGCRVHDGAGGSSGMALVRAPRYRVFDGERERRAARCGGGGYCWCKREQWEGVSGDGAPTVCVGAVGRGTWGRAARCEVERRGGTSMAGAGAACWRVDGASGSGEQHGATWTGRRIDSAGGSGGQPGASRGGGKAHRQCGWECCWCKRER